MSGVDRDRSVAVEVITGVVISNRGTCTSLHPLASDHHSDIAARVIRLCNSRSDVSLSFAA